MADQHNADYVCPTCGALLPADPEKCRNCGLHPIQAHGLCHTCYVYRWRTGRDRPRRPPKLSGEVRRQRANQRNRGALNDGTVSGSAS